MKEVIRYGFILGLICILAGGSLAIVNAVTKPIIILRRKAEEEASLRKVMPGAQNFEAVKSGEEIIYYKLRDKEGKFIGVAFKARGKGYSSVIETMVGMKRDGTIPAIKILSQNETPGLGNNIGETSFMARFSGKNTQDLSGVQAITGATISSRAVINSVIKKAQEIEKLIKDISD